ncbi:MAG: integral rane sensor signal transduction histidine kinase, partial [Verrucomicrobiales bacterium]|nr:integral rane sensor signal transduction histidine kinase [Verrucomicrobiales bacterium]
MEVALSKKRRSRHQPEYQSPHSVRENDGFDPIARRTTALFEESQYNIHVRADHLFAYLMTLQWFFGIGVALWISPRTWIGGSSHIHFHVIAAIFLGGMLASLPIYLAIKQPGQPLTRHVIAIAQMLTSALLIHLTGGRIETHFHVFGSLAFFAFYRDWRVLLTATIIVALDHMLRGIFWPQSVFGVLTSSPWRWIEHAGWVVFEDTFLFISIRQSLSEMFEVAERRSKLEAVNTEIERKVADRTGELRTAHQNLQVSEQRFRMLSASAPIGIFETDAVGKALFTNPYWQKIAGLSLSQSLDEGWQSALHPDDSGTIINEWKTAANDGLDFSREFRFRTPDGETRWVDARTTTIRSEKGEIAGYVGTVQDITKRKEAEAELEKVHRLLLEASHQAGMEEVATAVLHNVGNVLSSINVSSTLVADNLKKSKAGNLLKIVELLSAHESDLPSFLSTDSKGKRLPAYLAQLAEHLLHEQTVMLAEMTQLQSNIEHIKDIVSVQQGHSKVSGLVETLQLRDLIEDALKMNLNALMGSDIEIIREFDRVGPVTVQKHKVLQILVNLIRNAKYACAVSGSIKRQIRINLCNGDGRVRISVGDNGVGIPKENLARIFSHGFTTKKDGHGFGLHSGSRAARELGGSLTVRSDGPG